jgi:hypothetical protein
MPRKSEQQITLEEQHRHWMGKLKKARTLSQQLHVAKILKDIEARLWPNPVDEAVALAKAAKLQLKADKVAAAEGKKAEAAELERLTEIERQKVRDEANPVIDHVKRAVIRQELHQERAKSLASPVEATPIMGDLLLTTVDEAPVTAPVEATQVPGMVISPELATITREAEAAAKRQSSNTRRHEVVEFFEMATKPLESRDVVVPARRFVADTESSGPGETFARLGGYREDAPPEPVDEGGYLAEWNWVPKKW